jgi:carbamoyl-phosphate synthase large subunit
MNILLTSVGRRSYLVNYFKEALGRKGKVFAVNSEALTSGMATADESFVVPRVDSPNYIPDILKICHDNVVRLVISLFDIDLPYLAKAKKEFKTSGIELVVSDPWVVDVANDKWKTYQFFKYKNFNVPKTFIGLEEAILSLKIKEISFPMIIKPRWGMGSISLFKANSMDELRFFYNYAIKQVQESYLSILSSDAHDKSLVIQECINGDEYGLDVFNDLKGNYLITVPKKKLAMRAGETDIAMAVENESLLVIGEKISKCFKHPGNMDVDVFKGSDGKDYILEINPRFGGGYPFSHSFGVNMVKAIVDEVCGRSPRVNSPVTNKVAFKSINVLVTDGGFGS